MPRNWSIKSEEKERLNSESFAVIKSHSKKKNDINYPLTDTQARSRWKVALVSIVAPAEAPCYPSLVRSYACSDR